MRKTVASLSALTTLGLLFLFSSPALTAQAGTGWYRPTTSDPWGGSIQPWTGQTGATIGAPYNRSQFYSGRVGGKVGFQQNQNPLWGWIGAGQPKAYGTHLPPYPEQPGGGQGRGAYAGQTAGGRFGQAAGLGGQVPGSLYGKDDYSGGLLPGVPTPLGKTPGKTPGKAKGAEGNRMPGMPKWLNKPGRGRRILSQKDLGYGRDPARCFLLRMQDGVTVRPAEEQAFYPLTYWDKSRVLAPGSGIRVVAGGRALIVFPAGSQLDLSQPAEIWFRKGSQDRLELECRDVHTANINFGMREVRMSLPEGTRLRGRSLSFSISRERRPAPWMPGDTEDYFVVRNWGPGKLYVDSEVPGAETVTLGTNRRVVLPIPVKRETRPPVVHKDDPPLDLSMEGGGAPLQTSVQADVRFDGAALLIRSRTGKARLQWGGFAARLQPGWRLRIDPIGGTPFGQGRGVPHQRIPPKEPKK